MQEQTELAPAQRARDRKSERRQRLLRQRHLYEAELARRRERYAADIQRLDLEQRGDAIRLQDTSVDILRSRADITRLEAEAAEAKQLFEQLCSRLASARENLVDAEHMAASARKELDRVARRKEDKAHQLAWEVARIEKDIAKVDRRLGTTSSQAQCCVT